MQTVTLTAAQARALFRIDPTDGRIYWRVSHGRWSSRPAGALAGCLSKGYRRIGIGGVIHFGHRIAWLMEHGNWPTCTLDHINGKRDDNRACNLRLATAAENNQNQHGLPKHNTSGFRGVRWDAARRKWLATISINGKTKNLGRFADQYAAGAAYQCAQRLHHPTNFEAQQ